MNSRYNIKALTTSETLIQIIQRTMKFVDLATLENIYALIDVEIRERYEEKNNE